MRIKFLGVLATAVSAIMLMVACEPQSGPSGIKPADFVIENLRVGNTDAKFDVNVGDYAGQYIVACVDVATLKAEGVEDEQGFVSMYNEFLAVKAAAVSQDVRGYLESQGQLLTGNASSYRVSGLYPGEDYVVCSYGVEFSDEGMPEMVTSLSYALIKANVPAMREVSFDITTTFNGTCLIADVKPLNEYGGLYYYYIVKSSDVRYLPDGIDPDESYIDVLRRMAVDDFTAKLSEGLKTGDFCLYGEQTIREDLVAEAEYALVCFAVNEESLPVMCSMPTIVNFVSGSAVDKMTIDISVTDVTPYEAMLRVTPSNMEQKYACVFVSWEQFPKMDDDMELMDYMVSNYMPATFTGVHEEPLLPLMPATEYIVAAFAIDSTTSKPVSDLFSHRFTTPEAVAGSVVIDSIDIIKIFDVAEVAAIDPSFDYLTEMCQCMVLVYARTTPETDLIYWWWYDGFMRHEFSDEAFLEDLLLYGYTPPRQLIGLWYDEEFFFAGIAEDENGNFSDLYFGETFVLRYEDRSPAEEFFDYYAGANASAVMCNR